MTYKIVRMFFSDDHPSEVIKTGLSLDEAREWCRSPETSSKSCSDNPYPERGDWFDGFEKES